MYSLELTPTSRAAPKPGLWYLASPYAAPGARGEVWIRELRFRAVARVAGRLFYDKGIRTFCPISHTHPVSDEIKGLVDPALNDFWMDWVQELIGKCDGIMVAMLPGWEQSSGIEHERQEFRTSGKEERLFNPRQWFTDLEWKALEAWK